MLRIKFRHYNFVSDIGMSGFHFIADIRVSEFHLWHRSIWIPNIMVSGFTLKYSGVCFIADIVLSDFHRWHLKFWISFRISKCLNVISNIRVFGFHFEYRNVWLSSRIECSVLSRILVWYVCFSLLISKYLDFIVDIVISGISFLTSKCLDFTANNIQVFGFHLEYLVFHIIAAIQAYRYLRWNLNIRVLEINKHPSIKTQILGY